MSDTRNRSILASVLTAGGELIVFAVATLTLPAAWLIAARWVVGATGSALNFVVNRRWAFEARGQRKRGQAVRFAFATVVAVSLGTLLWWVGVSRTTIDPRLMHVASMVAVWLVFTYPVMSRWVFTNRRATNPMSPSTA